jgi:putative ABC transport system ATP-binding protein/lipoprotein-releasing system ATP-binding protein
MAPPAIELPATAVPVIEAAAVARRFPQGGQVLEALHPASFRVMPGDRIALMGPSGSGKSTLLQLMADLDRPSAGRLAWPALGTAGTLRPSRIGMVFQSPSLLPMLSVIENTELPLLLDGRPDGAHAAALQALEAVGLADLADKLPEELSGGQAQRVGIARALAHRPALILADEPTGQLDHATGRQVIDALLSALDGTGAALVVATHDPAVASPLASVWKLAHGHLSVAPADGGTA